MPYLILGIALLAGFLLAGRWYAHADPKLLIKSLKWLLIGLVLVIALFFLLSGKVGLALASLPALLPWIIRFRRAARAAKAFHRMAQQTAGGGTSGDGQTGQTSQVTTRYLKMELDHDSGAMRGEVLRGIHKGCPLDSLNTAELMSLMQECRSDDNQSAQVLETWLNRERPDWQNQTRDHTRPSASSGEMSRDEALQILGLGRTASDDEIREAHRHLIASMHPDKGGSTYLAAKINQAKDTLLS